MISVHLSHFIYEGGLQGSDTEYPVFEIIYFFLHSTLLYESRFCLDMWWKKKKLSIPSSLPGSRHSR